MSKSVIKRFLRKGLKTLTVGGTEYDLERLEIKSSPLTAKYILNPDAGRFEMIGTTRGADGTVLYKVRCLTNNGIYHFNQEIFKTFFCKETKE